MEYVRRAAYIELMTECGYNMERVVGRCFSITELKNRVIAGIRENKMQIKKLEKKLIEIRKENEARSQVLFDFCRKELEKETIPIPSRPKKENIHDE